MGAETAFLKEFVAEGVMQAQVGIAVFSASDFTVRAANPCYLQMIGCAGKDVVGKSLLSFVPQPDISSERFFKQVLLTGTSCTDHEVTVTYRDGDDGQAA